MLKVLINSYTCCPNMGSEPGMGWNWIVNLAKYCEVYVISEGEYKDKVEDFVRSKVQELEDSNLPKDAPERYAERMHFYWNPVSPEVRKMCWNQGDWRFYKYYKVWQKKTADIAREIIKGIPEGSKVPGSSKAPDGSNVPEGSKVSEGSNGSGIDVLHQLNMIGFREPGYLWQVSKETGIPFVWGPVDAKEAFPMAYASEADFRIRLKLHLKNVITKFQLKYSSRVHNAAKQGVVISASSNSQRSFMKYMGVDSPLINETGCEINYDTVPKFQGSFVPNDLLTILWVGKMDFRKQLNLALEAIAEMKGDNAKLIIVGGGDAKKYKVKAKELGMSESVTWLGSVSHGEVQKLMQESDVMLFTSVAEGTPHVVLEAIANSIPVLCFDTCGQGDSIDETVGRKISLSNPSQSVHDFAEQLRYFYDHRDALAKLKGGCVAKSMELSWGNKAKQMMQIYDKISK